MTVYLVSGFYLLSFLPFLSFPGVFLYEHCSIFVLIYYCLIWIHVVGLPGLQWSSLWQDCGSLLRQQSGTAGILTFRLFLLLSVSFTDCFCRCDKGRHHKIAFCSTTCHIHNSSSQDYNGAEKFLPLSDIVHGIIHVLAMVLLINPTKLPVLKHSRYNYLHNTW
jgi:hypothetical protein